MVSSIRRSDDTKLRNKIHWESDSLCRRASKSKLVMCGRTTKAYVAAQGNISDIAYGWELMKEILALTKKHDYPNVL